MIICSLWCRLEFGTTEVNGEEVKTNDILAMLSPEKEKVPLQKVPKHHTHARARTYTC